MRIIDLVRDFFRSQRQGPPVSHRPVPLLDWFAVTFDDETVHLRADPPGREPWSQSFTWDSVTRVCFKAEDFLASDGIYVFTTQRSESYATPTEARGGADLWSEILRRKLFDADLAIRAACSTGGVFCWPPEDAPS